MNRTHPVYLIDKSDWGDGPWQNEPDYDQWEDPFTGWVCVLRRHSRGNWCGYVMIPASVLQQIPNVAAFKAWADKEITVHGGVTYSKREYETDCHVFGFDTSHGNDYSPGIAAALRKVGDNLGFKSERYRNHAYCWLETYNMCRQIEEKLNDQKFLRALNVDE